MLLFVIKKQKENVVVVINDTEVATDNVIHKRDTVTKHQCIHRYKHNMNGCDQADQQLQYYGMQKRKSYNWWKIFHFLLEMTVINASIIFDRKPVSKDNHKRLKLKEFKSMLIDQLTPQSEKFHRKD